MLIIGAGVAGLATGIYGQLNGYATEIWEAHGQAGGECTGWTRQGYYFDGCIHWLLGTKAGTPLNRIWRETGALDDSVPIINAEYACAVLDGGESGTGQTHFLYRDTERLAAQLRAIAPEDGAAIANLVKGIRAMRAMAMPTEKPYDLMNPIDMARMIGPMLPAMRQAGMLGKQTIAEYVQKFRSPAARRLLSTLIPTWFSATALVSTLAQLADGDGGWPTGGSLALSRRMEQRYLSLGGRVHYHAPVARILTEGSRATGVQLADGRIVESDIVVSTADAHATLHGLLDGQHMNPALAAMYRDRDAYPVYTSVQVSLGIACDLSARPHTLHVPLAQPIEGGGAVTSVLGLKHHAYDSTLMPAGRTSVIAMLNADFDWWRERHQDRAAYAAEKRRLGAAVAAAVEAQYPEARGRIETIDVATPMTYVRYCHAWRGAWMAFATTPAAKVRYVPGDLPGLENVWLAGQWMMPPGGLPVAVLTGRWLVQRLCHLEKRRFVTEKDSPVPVRKGSPMPERRKEQ